jgi:hypothetical protein
LKIPNNVNFIRLHQKICPDLNRLLSWREAFKKHSIKKAFKKPKAGLHDIYIQRAGKSII